MSPQITATELKRWLYRYISEYAGTHEDYAGQVSGDQHYSRSAEALDRLANQPGHRPRRAHKNFSCDAAYSRSPTASRASARLSKIRIRRTRSASTRIAYQNRWSTPAPLASPSPVQSDFYEHLVASLSRLEDFHREPAQERLKLVEVGDRLLGTPPVALTSKRNGPRAAAERFVAPDVSRGGGRGGRTGAERRRRAAPRGAPHRSGRRGSNPY